MHAAPASEVARTAADTMPGIKARHSHKAASRLLFFITSDQLPVLIQRKPSWAYSSLLARCFFANSVTAAPNGSLAGTWPPSEAFQKAGGPLIRLSPWVEVTEHRQASPPIAGKDDVIHQTESKLPSRRFKSSRHRDVFTARHRIS